MNRTWFDKNKKNFKVQNISETQIDPGLTNLSGYSSAQIRTSGADSKHVQDLVVDIEKNGQQVPITLAKIMGKPGKYSYTIIDGNHRFSAIVEINESRLAAGLPPLTVMAVVHNRLTALQKIEMQIRYNAHEPSLRSTKEDELNAYKVAIGVHSAVNLSNCKDDAEAVEKIKQYVIKKGVSAWKPKTLAKKIYDTMPVQAKKIRSYTLKEAQKQWNSLHGIKSSTGRPLIWDESGVQDGIAVYFCDASGHTARAHGQMLEKFGSAPSQVQKTICVSWLKQSTGKKPEDVEIHRDLVERNLANVNHWLKSIGASKKIFDEVYFLPQILSGPSQDYGLIQGKTFHLKASQALNNIKNTP